MSNVTRQTLIDWIDHKSNQLLDTYSKANKEYAQEDNPFANFEDDAKQLGISRELSCTIFAGKHWRGIQAYVKGHKGQREHISGRFTDLHVYLYLLEAMVLEQENIDVSNAIDKG